VKDIEAGEIVTKEYIRSIRPGYGLPARYLEDVLGLTIKQSAKRGTRVSWDLFK